MRSKFTAILAVLFVLAVVFTVMPAVTAAKFSRRPPLPDKNGGPLDLQFYLELKLSDSQQAKMTKIINKYHDKEKSLKNKMMEARKNLMSVMHMEPFDEAAVRKTFRDASTLEEDVFILRAKMMNELNAVLTLKQKDMLKERKEQKMERFKQHFNPWHETRGE